MKEYLIDRNADLHAAVLSIGFVRVPNLPKAVQTLHIDNINFHSPNYSLSCVHQLVIKR